MEVRIFLAADYANVDGLSGKLNILGAFDRIYTKGEFPIRHHAMHLVIKLRAELGEISDATHELLIRLVDLDGHEVYAIPPLEFKIPMPEKGTRPEVNAVIEIRDLEFPRAGRYEFVVFMDDIRLGELPLDVEKVQQSSIEG